jgi:hypothetical protein
VTYYTHRHRDLWCRDDQIDGIDESRSALAVVEHPLDIHVDPLRERVDDRTVDGDGEDRLVYANANGGVRPPKKVRQRQALFSTPFLFSFPSVEADLVLGSTEGDMEDSVSLRAQDAHMSVVK